MQLRHLTFPGTMSRTRITTDRLKVVACTRVPEDVEDFLQTNAMPALLPSKGCCVLRMLLSALPTVHRLLLLLLLPVELPCPQSHPRSPEPEAPQYPPPPRPPPRPVPPPAPDDSIAVDSCDSDQDIDCDADSVASFEALDEAEHIGVHTQD